MSETSAAPNSDGSNLKQKVQSLRIPDDQKSSAGLSSAWFLVILFLTSTGYYIYRTSQLRGELQELKQLAERGEAKQSESTKNNGQAVAGVTSAAVDPGRSAGETTMAPAGAIALASNGYVTPAKQILVSPKVSGTVVTLNIEEGKQVRKGDVLAVIESTEYQADVDRQEALLAAARQRLLELERGSRPEEISQAEADLAAALTQLEEDERQYKRQLMLQKQNAGTESDLTQSKAQFEGQQKRVERSQLTLDLLKKGERAERIEIARAEVHQVEADLVRAKWRLGNCVISAPISGTILRKNAEEGNVVNPVAFNGSFSICEMADLSNLEIDLKILESDIRKIRVGQKCSISTKAWPGRVYEGVVDRLMPIADRANGAIPTRVKVTVPVEEEGLYLKPEMSADVIFYTGEPSAVQPLAESK